MERKLLRLVLAAAVLVASPGLPPYEAAAGILSATVSVRQGPAWLPAVSAAAARLQSSPGAGSQSALRVLGQARLELALRPRNLSALLFVAELPDEASSPEALAKLPAEEQSRLLSRACERASGKLSAEAATLLERSRGAEFSAADRRRLARIAESWFYLPKDQANVVKSFSAKKGASLAGRLAAALRARVNAMIGVPAPVHPAVEAESRLLFSDIGRLVDGHGKPSVQGTLAPYARKALDAAVARLQERGVGPETLPAYLLENHRTAFGWDAPHALIKPLRQAGAWTGFVSAVSLTAADRLSAVPSPGAVSALQKAGADYDLRLPIPEWHPLTGQAESVAAWLSTKYGAPPEAPLGKGLKLGRWFGVPVLVTRGAFLAVLAMAAQLHYLGDNRVGPVSALLTSIAMYAGVLGHEFGHALMARAYKTPTSKIELNLLGGGAFIAHEYREGLPEFMVALAGPLVTLALAFLPIALGRLHLLRWLPKAALPSLGLFISLNIFIGLMNLLPLLPLDGGRMLRGALTGLLRDDYTAFRVTRLFAKAVKWSGMAACCALVITGHGALGWTILILSLMAGLGGGSSSAHPGTKLVDEDKNSGRLEALIAPRPDALGQGLPEVRRQL